MKITVISQWYNDEFLAPFFLKHYSYADEIVVLMETDTNDSTREILLDHVYSGWNITLWEVHCPGGHDDRCKVDNVNQWASSIDEGWIIPVDSDEFVFPEFHEDIRNFLSRQTADVVMAQYYYVYRHVTEGELDPEKDVISQRVHGQDMGEGNNYYKYTKVGAYRVGKGIELTIGYHGFIGDHPISKERFIGSHWNMADEKIARRRLVSRDRMSENNKKHGYGRHNFHITEEKLMRQLKENSNLPVLDALIRKDEWA